MAKYKTVGKVHGNNSTYEIREKSGLWSNKYWVKRSDGKLYGSYSSRAKAFRAAHKKAGPDSYES